MLTFQVFAKENCPICVKAQGVLKRLGVEPVVRYVDGPQATAENVADLAWYDWADKMPLVVVTHGETVVKRWTGENVVGAWLPEIRTWLASQRNAAPDS